MGLTTRLRLAFDVLMGRALPTPISSTKLRPSSPRTQPSSSGSSEAPKANEAVVLQGPWTFHPPCPGCEQPILTGQAVLAVDGVVHHDGLCAFANTVVTTDIAAECSPGGAPHIHTRVEMASPGLETPVDVEAVGVMPPAGD